MSTKSLVLMALLVSTGAALYVVIPGFNGGMKPDFMLTMMFVGILLFPYAKHVFLLAATTGILSGLFSTFPGGFLPNIVDKLITAFIFLLAVQLLKKYASRLPAVISLTAAGTLLSGTIFLSAAILLIGAEIPFLPLVLTVVLPAMVLNAIAIGFIYPIIMTLVKRSKFETAVSAA
ncbi:tryptophan transporter [Indiicoccus explosivorum]|uniref:tryptophan transporter n=1 Tax=Indiicoccus explosivorum TaxID=1917864 RepID=UPI000B44E691|nr:tryptophan transporter [Indiicoccus explosivorum]